MERSIFRNVLAGLVVLMVQGAGRADYPAWSVEDLAERADAIVLARVSAFKVDAGAGAGSATLEIKATLKGEEIKGPITLGVKVGEDEWYPKEGTFVFFLKKEGEGFALVNREDSVSAKAGAEELKRLKESMAETDEYRRLYAVYKGMIAEAAKKGDKEELGKITEKFHETNGRTLRTAHIWKTGEQTELVFAKVYGKLDVVNKIHFAQSDKVHVARVGDIVQVETNRKPDGTYEDGVIIKLTFSEKAKAKAGAGQEAARGAEIAWGKAVDRVELGVALAEPAREYRGGESVKLKLYVRNTWEKPVEIGWWVPLDFFAQTTLVDAEGMTIDVVPTMTVTYGTFETKRTIAPGETVEIGERKVLLLTGRNMMPEDPVPPGIYRLSQSLSIRNLRKGWEAAGTGLVTGEVMIKVAGTVQVVMMEFKVEAGSGLPFVVLASERMKGKAAEAIYAALGEKVKGLDAQAIIHVTTEGEIPAEMQRKVYSICATGQRRVAVTGFISTPNPWGEEAGGVAARVSADQLQYKAGETPTLKAEVVNHGDREFDLLAQKEFHCRVRVDGTLYERALGGMIHMRYPAAEVAPGKEPSYAVEVKLDGLWVGAEGGKELQLTPGRHEVRVVFEGFPKRERAEIRRDPGAKVEKVVVTSNAVVIEVVGAEGDGAVWGEAVKGLRWRVWVEPDKVEVGGSGVVNFEFQNVSDKELRIYKQEGTGRPRGVLCSFVLADGSRIEWADEALEDENVRADDTVLLKPKEVYRAKWQMGENIANGLKPGRVEMKLMYLSPRNTNAALKDFWEGRFEKTVVFEAVKAGADEAGWGEAGEIRGYAGLLEKVLPKGWTVSVKGKRITVGRTEEIEWYNPLSLPSQDIEYLRKRGYTLKGKYGLVLDFGPAISTEELKRLRKENEATKTEIEKQREKMKPFWGKGQYEPRTAEEREQVAQMKKLEASWHRLPDVVTGDASVYVKVSLKGADYDHSGDLEAGKVASWSIALGSKEVETECLKVQEEVLGELKAWEEKK